MLLLAMSVCWAVFIGAWALGALYNSRFAPATIRRESRVSLKPWQLWIVSAAGVLLLQTLVPRSMWAAITFRSDWLSALGLVLLIGSTMLTLWARCTLGRMWSFVPSLREHHELHTAGPYRLTRHPIYTGILGMVLGSALVAGSGGVLLTVLLLGLVFLGRIHSEEKLMLETFGERYSRYQREVPRLVPFLHI